MTTPDGKTVGIGLSGGGFRATLFNLGGLWRLNDAGMLQQLDRVTSVSGGSITAARLAYRWPYLRFAANGVAAGFVDEVVRPLQSFCHRHIDVRGIGGVLNPFSKAWKPIAKAYDKYLFDGVTLAALPDDASGPRFIIYATNLQTGVSFRFSRPYLADWRLGMLPDPATPLSKAVAASAAFPPLLSPVVLKTDPSRWTDGPPPGPELDRMRRKIYLADGGVYDNMGLEAIWDKMDRVLVSDAGGPFEEESKQASFWPSQLGRVRNVMMEQTRALRRRMVLAELTSGRKEGALWRIETRIDDFEVTGAMTRDSATTEQLQHIRTRLNPFTDREQGQLINWGYALCDAALRKYVDTSLPAGSWPVPEYAL